MKASKITIFYNNGSVPPQYAYHYEINFSAETGEAQFKLFSGYYEDEKLLFSESISFDQETLQQLLPEIPQLKSDNNSPNIGGSQRIIETINQETKKYVIAADNETGIQLFNCFLYLYDEDIMNTIHKFINY